MVSVRLRRARCLAICCFIACISFVVCVICKSCLRRPIRSDSDHFQIEKIFRVGPDDVAVDQLARSFCAELFSIDKLSSCGVGFDNSVVPLFMNGIRLVESKTEFEIQWYFTNASDSWLTVKWYRSRCIDDAKFAEARDMSFAAVSFAVDSAPESGNGMVTIKCWQRGSQLKVGIGKPCFVIWVNELRIEFDSRADVDSVQFKKVVEFSSDTLHRAIQMYPKIADAISNSR